MEANTPVRYSGLELKLQRVAADIRAADLAAEMGVHPSRVHYIEGRRVTSVGAAEQYLTALATLTTKTTAA